MTVPNEGAWDAYAPQWAKDEAAAWEQSILDLHTPGRRLGSIPLGDIEVQPVEWLWKDWLTVGQLHMLVGKSGWGKSTYASWLVGRLSTGEPWPNEPGVWRTPVRCGVLSLEETDHGRLKARLMEAGADPGQVDLLTSIRDVDEAGVATTAMWELPRDCPALTSRIVEHGYGLVVIDGLGYAVSGDSHNYANVGSALISLAGVASDTGAAILGIMHPPKAAATADTAAIGSYAWTTVPRISWLLGKDPTDQREDDEPDVRRAVMVATTNYKHPPHGWSFQIGENEEEVPRVENMQLCMIPADDILRPSDGAREVVEWLRGVLKDGPKLATVVRSAAESVEIGWRTCERYKRAAGAASMKGKEGWVWYLR